MSNCGEVSGATSVFCEPILISKGTVHIGMKETRARTTMITSASSDVHRLKKSLKKKQRKMDKSMIQLLSVSKTRGVF